MRPARPSYSLPPSTTMLLNVQRVRHEHVLAARSRFMLDHVRPMPTHSLRRHWLDRKDGRSARIANDGWSWTMVAIISRMFPARHPQNEALIISRCRCRHEFCYLCGEVWKRCACDQWDPERLLARANQVVVKKKPSGPGCSGIGSDG